MRSLRNRPAAPGDLYAVIGYRGGLGPLLAQRWRRRGRKVVLVLPRRPGPEHHVPPGLPLAVAKRGELLELLRDPAKLLDAARRWAKKGRRHVPSNTGLHLLHLGVEEASDLMDVLGALGPRPGRVFFLSDPRVMGSLASTEPWDESRKPDPQGPAAASLLDAEQVAARAASAGRVVVALRTTPYLWGPGLAPLTPLGPDMLLPERLLRRYPILWVSGANPTQPLHVDDLGAALDALLEAPGPEALYHLRGPELFTWDELLWELHGCLQSEEEPAVEELRPEELALRKPELARRYTDVARVPPLDDGLMRGSLYAADIRLSQRGRAWLEWCLQQQRFDHGEGEEPVEGGEEGAEEPPDDFDEAAEVLPEVY